MAAGCVDLSMMTTGHLPTLSSIKQPIGRYSHTAAGLGAQLLLFANVLKEHMSSREDRLHGATAEPNSDPMPPIGPTIHPFPLYPACRCPLCSLDWVVALISTPTLSSKCSVSTCRLKNETWWEKPTRIHCELWLKNAVNVTIKTYWDVSNYFFFNQSEYLNAMHYEVILDIYSTILLDSVRAMSKKIAVVTMDVKSHCKANLCAI